MHFYRAASGLAIVGNEVTSEFDETWNEWCINWIQWRVCIGALYDVRNCSLGGHMTVWPQAGVHENMWPQASVGEYRQGMYVCRVLEMWPQASVGKCRRSQASAGECRQVSVTMGKCTWALLSVGGWYISYVISLLELTILAPMTSTSRQCTLLQS